MDLRSRERKIVEQAERVAAARAERVGQADDDEEALAAIAAAPTAAPLVPGHHLGVSAQPKRKKRRS